nr:MAG: hypothetical protein DIU81_02085 [[Clostridium] cellulosi]
MIMNFIKQKVAKSKKSTNLKCTKRTIYFSSMASRKCQTGYTTIQKSFITVYESPFFKNQQNPH